MYVFCCFDGVACFLFVCFFVCVVCCLLFVCLLLWVVVCCCLWLLLFVVLLLVVRFFCSVSSFCCYFAFAPGSLSVGRCLRFVVWCSALFVIVDVCCFLFGGWCVLLVCRLLCVVCCVFVVVCRLLFVVRCLMSKVCRCRSLFVIGCLLFAVRVVMRVVYRDVSV